MIFRFPAKKRQDEAVPAPAASGEAFQAALLAALPRLRRYAVALTGNVAAADDLLQDAVERALRRRETLGSLESLYGWIRSILHNLYIDEVRRQRSRGVTTDIDDLTDALTPVAVVSDRGEIRDFVGAMAALSEDHRQILLLVGVEGLSYREIAEELGIPIGTVMSRLARAREQLRGRLDPPTPLRLAGKP